MNPGKEIRFGVAALSIAGLLMVFLYQRFDVAHLVFHEISRTTAFIINRTIRFLVNDLFALGLIYALFPIRRYVTFAVAVQLVGVVLFLVPYFILKIYHPSYNGPLINFIHRLILNPILLLLLIPAFYYQRNVTKM
jgi:exosortase F-associated protein